MCSIVYHEYEIKEMNAPRAVYIIFIHGSECASFAPPPLSAISPMISSKPIIYIILLSLLSSIRVPKPAACT